MLLFKQMFPELLRGHPGKPFDKTIKIGTVFKMSPVRNIPEGEGGILHHFFDDFHALSGKISLEGLVHAFAEKPGKIAWVIAGQICKILQ